MLTKLSIFKGLCGRQVSLIYHEAIKFLEAKSAQLNSMGIRKS